MFSSSTVCPVILNLTIVEGYVVFTKKGNFVNQGGKRINYVMAILKHKVKDHKLEFNQAEKSGCY